VSDDTRLRGEFLLDPQAWQLSLDYGDLDHTTVADGAHVPAATSL
jgi:hypothetical protein